MQVKDNDGAGSDLKKTGLQNTILFLEEGTSV
jgi:hypothetical protein